MLKNTTAAEEFAAPQRPESFNRSQSNGKVVTMVAVSTLSWEEVSAPEFGNPARQAWREAVTQVEEQLRAKLRVEVLPERMRKALRRDN